MKWAAAIFLILIVTILILADSGRMPDFLANLYNFPNGDKIGHFLLVGILSFLVNASIVPIFTLERSVRSVLGGSLILVLLAGIEEWSQQFFSHRHASLLDFLSSLAGIIFFAWLAWMWQAKKTKKLEKVE
jgi:VanZ family protein